MAGIGKSLMTGIISDYYSKGGKASGALGVLDNIIKERERTRTEQTDITKSLLGVPEVARGVAQQRGMPFVESEEDIQSKKYRGLQITRAEQDIAGASIDDARRQSIRVQTAISQPTSQIFARKIDREKYIDMAKTQVGSLWTILPLPDQSAFEEYVGSIWDMVNPRKTKKTVTQPKTTGRYKVTPY